MWRRKAGDLKLGNFEIAFTDLTIPVAGIPISITRSYNSLYTATKGDFGQGWRLALAGSFDCGCVTAQHTVTRPSDVLYASQTSNVPRSVGPA